ncbi:MAG: biotin--[acetyl-CoA-carboxylase] ligase [Ignavibacteriaceae bacterium]
METKSSFNLNKFDIKLETEIIGRNFLYFTEIDSTNAVLMDKAGKHPDGTVVFAEKQLAGKGRFNNVWESDMGQNLTFSILLNIGKHLRNKLNILNLGTAQVLGATIENLFQLQVEVKWPNDLLIKRKKVAGILIESVSLGSTIQKAVVGIGLNVNQTQFNDEYNYPATSLKLELNQNAERERILAEFLNNFEELLQKVEQNPATVLQNWREKCKMIGEKICLNQDGKMKYGVFDDIDENGQLLLRTDKGIKVINYGDVTSVR